MGILHITVFVFITIIASFSLSQVYALPIVFDDDYIVEKFATGLEYPITMTFVGEDILVIEKNTGKVIRIQDNGVRYNEPVLDVPVSNTFEAGLVGIASVSNHVYLYFTESLSGLDKYGVENSKNTVQQYDWNGEKLTNPTLIKELLAVANVHHGGVITTSLNNEVYFVIGDQHQRTVFQNIPVETILETGSIFKIDTESNNNVELFAMGIRNSFGLAVDPVTGYLWDTENGADNYDEINLVKPGFNSGWLSVMGPVDRYNPDTGGFQTIPPPFENFEYSDPEFSWYVGGIRDTSLPSSECSSLSSCRERSQVGPTAIAFPDQVSFGKYSDWLFVGDFHNGIIWNFQLNTDRTGFVFSDPDLSDLVLDDNDEIDKIIFAKGFQGVTDIKFHDGVMYVISIGDGSIYKIYSKELAEEKKIWNVEMLKLLKTRTGSEYINLSNTDFRGINLDNVNISNVNFTRANLSHANLSGQDITGTILTGANLSNANLTGVDLSGMDLTGTRLTGADLSGMDLTDTILMGAYLSDTNLSNAILTNANLENAHLENANLLDVNLDSANLTNADLRNTILVDANLSNTILAGADLTNAAVTGIILTGADLENAVLTDTILNCGATVKDKTGIQSLECYIALFTQTCKFWIFNLCN